MNKKRLLLGMFFLLLAIGGVAYFFNPSEKKILERARLALVTGSYLECEQEIKSLKGKKLKEPTALYRGHLALVQGQSGAAALLFSQAEKEDNVSSLLKLELLLGKAFCCYHEQQFVEAEILLAEVEEHYLHHRFVSLLKGMIAFEKGLYKEVIFHLSAIDFETIEEEPCATRWASFVFKKMIRQEEMEFRLARAFIEESDYLLGREMLERIIQSESPLVLHHLSALYLGYSYIKEAEQSPVALQAPLYQLASLYFERSSISSLTEKEKSGIATKVGKQASQLLMQEPFHEASFLTLIQPLQKWHATKELEVMAKQMVDTLLSAHSFHEHPFTLLVCSHLNNSLFHHMVIDHLVASITKEREEITLFHRKLRLMEALLPDTILFQQRCYPLIMQHIDYAIMQDDDELEQLQYDLSLLHTMKQSIESCGQLASKLLEQSKLLWQDRGEERKATKLMQLALEISPQKQVTKETISHYLTALFDQAEACNLVDRLTLIYDALVLFNLKMKRIIDPAVLANHLADAHYRFQTGQFSSSKILSSWVLKWDPTNQDALRLLGLNYYYLGDYQEAVASLQKLLILDQDSHKALWLSEAFSGIDQRHLVQIDKIDVFETDK